MAVSSAKREETVRVLGKESRRGERKRREKVDEVFHIKKIVAKALKSLLEEEKGKKVKVMEQELTPCVVNML